MDEWIDGWMIKPDNCIVDASVCMECAMCCAYALSVRTMDCVRVKFIELFDIISVSIKRYIASLLPLISDENTHVKIVCVACVQLK